MKRLISILSIFIIILLTLMSCDLSKKNDNAQSIVFNTGFPDIIEMSVGDELTDNYVMFKGIVDFKNNNVIFVSSDENIVRVDVSTQEFPIYTYFDIIAVSAGEAIIYAQSADGSVISAPVKITVIDAPETSCVTEETSITTEPKIETETETKLPQETEASVESESSPIIETETETEIETENESVTETIEETVEETVEETTPVPDTEPNTERETEAEIEPETETETEVEVEIEIQTETETETETDPYSESETETPSINTTKTETERPTETEQETETATDSKEEVYILNTKSKKIHRPDCRYVKQMKEENKEEFRGDLNELLSNGYTACKTCKP